jgi:hypothetical protein
MMFRSAVMTRAGKLTGFCNMIAAGRLQQSASCHRLGACRQE